MPLASPEDTDRLWRELEKSILYNDPEAPLHRYVGALYKFVCFEPKQPNAPRSMLPSMDGYVKNAVQRFKAEYGKKLHRWTSPYLTP